RIGEFITLHHEEAAAQMPQRLNSRIVRWQPGRAAIDERASRIAAAEGANRPGVVRRDGQRRKRRRGGLGRTGKHYKQSEIAHGDWPRSLAPLYPIEES